MSIPQTSTTHQIETPAVAAAGASIKQPTSNTIIAQPGDLTPKDFQDSLFFLTRNLSSDTAKLAQDLLREELRPLLERFLEVGDAFDHVVMINALREWLKDEDYLDTVGLFSVYFCLTLGIDQIPQTGFDNERRRALALEYATDRMRKEAVRG